MRVFSLLLNVYCLLFTVYGLQYTVYSLQFTQLTFQLMGNSWSSECHQAKEQREPNDARIN